MNVYTPAIRDIQNRLGQEQTVGDDDDQVGLTGFDLILNFSVTKTERLKQRQSMTGCKILHRTWPQLSATSRRAIRLSQDSDYFVAGFDKAAQTRDCKIRCARENNFCGHARPYISGTRFE